MNVNEIDVPLIFSILAFQTWPKIKAFQLKTYSLLNWEYLWIGFQPGEETNISRLCWSIDRDRSDVWNKVFCNLYNQ